MQKEDVEDLSKDELVLLEYWLLLLFISSEKLPIKGKTMLMKQIFILANEINKSLNDHFDFFPAKYGPYSNNAAKVINILRNDGFVKGTKNGRDTKYEITEKGIERLSQLSQLANSDQISKINVMKESTLQWGLKKVLNYVYSRYPEYTPYSKIRGTVLG